jgi:hypothetical protein
MKIRTLDIEELNDRLSELEGLRDAISFHRDALEESETDEGKSESQELLDAAILDFGTDEQKELKALEAIKDEIGEARGKINDEGGPFVHENDFEDYARELADEIGAISGRESWPLNCIDWAFAAEELKGDYSSVEWNGTTYLYRA